MTNTNVRKETTSSAALSAVSDYEYGNTRKVSKSQVPYDLQAEQNTLGAMLQSRDAIVDVLDIIRDPEVFYDSKHKLIFEQIQILYVQGIEVDQTTVKNLLDQKNLLELAGGIAYLYDLIDVPVLTSAAAEYARIVRGQSLRRNIIQAGDQIKALGLKKDGTSPELLLDQAESIISNASGFDMSEDFINIDVLMHDIGEYLENARLNGGVSGISSPYVDLNKILHGFKPGQLIIVGGRPSMGKSTILLDLVRHAAFVQNIPSAIFSLEDKPMLLSLKILSAESSVSSSTITQGKYNQQEFQKITQTQQRLATKSLRVDGSSHLTILEIHTKCRRLQQHLQREGKELGLVLIDYLQLIHMGEDPNSRQQHENRQQAVAYISRSLKALAKELHVPVIAAAQLNRTSEEHTNRPPRMSELRGSGQIEQDADVILLIHRKISEENNYDVTTQLIVEKNQAGERGSKVDLLIDTQHSRFLNASFS
jgi:replicative DNA helicase